MRTCPTCEHPVPDGAHACPTCGISQAPASPAARRLARVGLWALTVFIVAAVAIPAAESATSLHRGDAAGAPGACAVPEDAGSAALPPGHPPIGNALPPGHPPIGELPPGHPPIGDEALPPGHPPIGRGAPSAPLPIFSGPQSLDI